MLLRCGAEYVLLGEGRDASLRPADLLLGAEGVLRTDARPATGGRVNGALHALAAAIAAGLARGLAMELAVAEAHAYLGAISATVYAPGMGGGLVDRIAPLRGTS